MRNVAKLVYPRITEKKLIKVMLHSQYFYNKIVDGSDN